ncbi:amino acid ABC transporter substrate-binding protein [Enterococcus dongliensis]|uniref:Amino acid ABC transporter substrate-binding protein n=1 Tax=Enterococcus dongliensis TaxID=2559925 RepID=A0AAP5NMY9_9ENTE|nr:amino acid ABC transporter substrate-binding protein [Enterococcus dongliensis]MDT2595432.1 amino acid ABC transporter substrate-binding protein [Enterococcus dongliensis]MDT2603354.1 amino acid ABC transporter substrate-binding protein [Enterococcus dongliensis]MDT2633715.1 amino acid ABC transporter substrate-binding protein [Enterococcus dongliensis]MDT2635911.1 amino acid ABC transporter substrate-binding protein [Enterococcus dongliensis]MDT2641669.1 amino acid ABC transporter substrat
MKKSMIAIASLLVVGALFLAGCQSKTTDKTSSNNTLRVGTEGTYSPFSFRDDNDKLTGYDVEVAKAVAKKIDYKVKFVEAPWDSMLAAFDANKSDVVFNQVAITPERQEKYLFSTPYSISHPALIVNKNNTEIKDFADLKGKTAAQSLTSNYAQMAEDLGAKISSVDGFSKAVELVGDDRADATLNDDVTYYDYLNQKPEAPIKIVKTSDEATEVAAMFHKKDKELAKKVDKAIKELKADGTLTKLSEKYFKKDISK